MPSPAHEVASLFTQQPDDQEVDGGGLLKGVSLRLPASRLAFVDALAENADLSRNAMLNQLIRVGVSAVMAELPDVIREEVEQSLVERLGAL